MRPIAFLAALAVALSLAVAPAAAATDWTWPVHGDVVTSYRNGDDPYASGQHRGVDIAAPVGAPVVAATGGRVTFAGTAGSSGLTVSMRTGDGAYDLSYLHLSSLAVHEGDAVDRGAPIGSVGVSGRRSVEQPHLHFGVRLAGSKTAYRDPLAFLPPVAPPAPAPEAPPAAAPATAPAPVDAPVAAPPAASPVAAAPAPAPEAGPSPHRAVDFENGFHSAHGLAFENRGARHVAPTRSRATVHATTPKHGTAHDHSAAVRHPALGPPAASRSDATTRVGAAQALEPRHGATARHRGGGPDIGWLAALIGLLAAALCLGRPNAPTRVARAGRARVGALLRPLGGRG